MNTTNPSRGDKHFIQSTVSATPQDGSIVEMVFDLDKNTTALCVGKDGSWQIKSEVTNGMQRLVPYSPYNNLLQHNVLLLPSKPAEYGSEQSLMADIRSYIHRYVDVSPCFEEIASYYALLSWVYDSFNELPYLRFRGDFGSGKTRALLVIGSICYKPIFASGASTVSPLFRMLDTIRGTLIIDEGDFRFSDEKAEIVKILNNGNAKGFPVLRSEVSPKGEFNPHAYTVFGPKLVATRRQFHDRALESRCITEEMGQRKLREDIPITLPAAQKEEARELRNKLLLFRLRTAGQAVQVDPPTSRDIEPRLSQVFAPLLSIIKDEATKVHLVSLVHDYNDDMVSDRGMDSEAQVLEVIRDLMNADADRLAIKEISSWFLDRYGDEYGRKISARWIGNIVRNRLYLKTQKSNGVFVIPVSENPKLHRLFERYGIENRPSEGDASKEPV